MICPDCYSRVQATSKLSWFERFINLFTPYTVCRCPECHWRGPLAVNSLPLPQQYKQSVVGWVLGILIALTVAWFVVGDMGTSGINPSGASAEMKWGW